MSTDKQTVDAIQLSKIFEAVIASKGVDDYHAIFPKHISEGSTLRVVDSKNELVAECRVRYTSTIICTDTEVGMKLLFDNVVLVEGAPSVVSYRPKRDEKLVEDLDNID